MLFLKRGETMDLKSILEYQKKDAELIKLERQLETSENKKISNQMVSVVKEAQNQSTALENQAKEIIASFNSLKKSYADNIKSAGVVANKKLENLSSEDLEVIEELSQTILNNLGILEKKLLAQAEKVRAILSNFDQTKKRYNLARDKYNKHKEMYEAEMEKLKPQLEQKTAEVKALEANIDAKLLAKYKQKRQEKIHSVFVPCIDKMCGGCSMELPLASLSALKKNGVLECEHCRRIIYLADGK